MGKNTKVMPQNAPLSIFFLGKGRESLHLKPYEKLSVQMHFLTCSPAHTKLDKASITHLKIAQNVYFSCEFNTFPVTEGNKIRHLYSSYDLNKKAHPQHEFQEQQNYSSLRTRGPSKSDPERHKFLEHKTYSSLQTRESSNPTQKDTNFEKMHSLTPAKNAHKIRKVFVFPELCTLHTFIQMHSLTPSNTNQLTTFGNT